MTIVTRPGLRRWRVAGLVVLAFACHRDAGTDSAEAAPAVKRSPAEPAPTARVRSEDAWLDLIAQRPNAVVHRDGVLRVDLGQEQARKHLELGIRSPWRLAEDVDGRRAGIVTGRSASVDIPLDGNLSPGLHPGTDEHSGLALAVTVRALAPKQSMTVLLNDRPLAHLRIKDSWARRTVSLPDDAVRTGDNRIRLHFRRTTVSGDVSVSAAVATLEVGNHLAIAEPVEQSQPAGYRAEPRADGGIELLLRPGTGLAYYFVPPPRGRLALGVRGRGSLEVDISLDADHRAGREPHEILQEPLRPTGSTPELDLSGWSGKPVRLEVRVRGTTDGAGARFESMRVVAPRSLPIDSRQREPRDLVVLAIEGARADSLLDVGRRPALETLTRFAQESLTFARAHALGAAAVPSHAGWMSSVVPPVHLTLRGTFVADGQAMLAELLGRAGYFNVAVTANEYFNVGRGLLQGIDDESTIVGGGDKSDARVVVSRALERIAGRKRPRSLFAVVDDPHAPYDPPRELLTRVEVPPGAALPHVTHVWVGRVRMGRTQPNEDELRYVRRLYRGELEVIDMALEQLLGALRADDRLDDAIVVVLGVHGEEFFEHEGAGHGHSLQQECIHVPLMIRAPSLLSPGRVDEPVDLLDLAPTLADLLGLPFPEEWQGESLVPMIDDPVPPPRLVMSYLGDGSRAGIVGNYKLILGPGRGPGSRRFYDLSADPGEREDLIEDGGVALRILRAALSWQLAHETRWKRARWGTGANLRAAFALDLGI